MEAIPSASRPVSRDRAVNGSYTPRPWAASERDSIRNGASVRTPDENLSSTNLPKAFQGMLKTTTETGHSGMFSIKPSRIPQNLNSPRRTGGTYNENALQKPWQALQPYGVPAVDDRRRLPSYTRDATSEVISMYEPASQKSGSRVFGDPDYRSYSMDQQSPQASYMLSPHRSYTSLRSQTDSSGFLQRPRSPFAYHTRLKRPGFRPSSPALTDGGVVDYSRRAEIERLPHGAGHSTSSPSSLHAQKRRPPPSLRPEGNRSTPSLLSQSSSQRRSPGSNPRQSNGTQGTDWSGKRAPTSVTTSPARCTFSLASTANRYATGAPPSALLSAPPSTTTTPAKLHTPSPLYYDYTEDFDVDGYNQLEALTPPPQFHIKKAISETRRMKERRPSAASTYAPTPNASQRSDLCMSFPYISIIETSATDSHDTEKQPPEISIVEPDQQTTEIIAVDIQSEDELVDTQRNVKRDTKIIRLSGLGHGARELSTHVEEVFGLPSVPSFEVSIPHTSDQSADDGARTSTVTDKQDGLNVNSVPTRTHSCRENTLLLKISSTPEQKITQFRESDTISQEQENVDANPHLQGSQENCRPAHPSSHNFAGSEEYGIRGSRASSLIYTPSSRLQRYRSSGLNSMDTGLTELAELITNYEDANRSRTSYEKSPISMPPPKTPMIFPTLPDELLLQNASSENSIAPPLSSFKQADPKDAQDVPTYQPLQPIDCNQHHQRRREIQPPAPLDFEETDLQNFGRETPRKLISRSESPMLAPKPISPARQLKLKNSIPQLMKALPPIPTDLPIRAVSPRDHLTATAEELPCQFSPLISGCGSTLSQEIQETCKLAQENEENQIGPQQNEAELVESEVRSIQAVVGEQEPGQGKELSPPLPPRLRPKLRNSGSLRPLSPPDSRPWNLEESYPWSTQNVNVRLPSLIQDDMSRYPKHPTEFKLKITRDSNSTQGTIRVHGDSSESKPLAGLQLRNPKDLSILASGIDNIFRQVGEHLHSTKLSASSIQMPAERSSAAISQPVSNHIAANENPNADLNSHGSSPSTNLVSASSEARSCFSDDSSHEDERTRLRKRLSNLKARMAVPYKSKFGARSHDDITWRDRGGAEAPTPSAVRSVPNLHARSNTEGRPMRHYAERAHGQKFKMKLRAWLRGARSAIASCVKSRSSTDHGEDGKPKGTIV